MGVYAAAALVETMKSFFLSSMNLFGKRKDFQYGQKRTDLKFPIFGY